MQNRTEEGLARAGLVAGRVASQMNSTTPVGRIASSSPQAEERKQALAQRVNVLFAEMQSIKPLMFRSSWPTKERQEAAKAQYLAVREFRQWGWVVQELFKACDRLDRLALVPLCRVLREERGMRAAA